MSTLTNALPSPGVELSFDLRSLLVPPTPSSAHAKQETGLMKQEMTLLRESAFPMRTRMFDEEVATFLLLHPAGTVVQIGGGVRSRFLRLDNGSAHWVDVDGRQGEPRKSEQAPESDRIQHLCSDLEMDAWIRELRAQPGPYCFVLGSRPGCFQGADIDSIVLALRAQFPGAWLIFEDATVSASQAVNEHQLVQQLLHAYRTRSEGRIQQRIYRLGAVVDRSRTLLDHLDLLLDALPGLSRFFVQCFPGRYRERFLDYQVLRVVLAH